MSVDEKRTEERSQSEEGLFADLPYIAGKSSVPRP